MDALFDSTDAVRNANPLKHACEFLYSSPVNLERGGCLSEVRITYETYGELNLRKDNAVLICHAISGDSHVAAHDELDNTGWWEIMVGPGKPIDTDKYFVICPNFLGGCRGSTGPDSINPDTGYQYGLDFPEITVGDIVEVDCLLIDSLGITRLLSVVGGSLGGVVTLEWATRFPDRVLSAIPLATAAHMTSQALAFDIVARNAILSDPNYLGGRYYEKGVIPASGLAIARMLGHITYLSRESMMKKFDSTRNQARKIETAFETKFSVGSYLAYQGGKFVERFDANSYVVLTTAIDNFDLGSTPIELQKSLKRSMCRWLILSFTTDWLFPSFLSMELVNALLATDKRVSYCDIPSECGHDGFLLPDEFEIYGEMIRSFLSNISFEVLSGGVLQLERPDRIDYEQILDLIPRGAKVLDLGCGKGGLLARLRQRSECSRVQGIEIKEKYVLRCIERGLDVVQADLNDGLHAFSDHQFDFVVLSKTLQTVRDVEFVLDEMLRVGVRGIVSFPNLGFHEHRRRLMNEGQAPKLDFDDAKEWYNTSDVRFLTLKDFEYFCSKKGINVHHCIAIDTKQQKQIDQNPNENADVVILVISK
ncbi:MAG: homoserine O-acetyltransferase [Planctomycetaceae bacterium]|jgi:homoserine O-acetyltransferase|nr:homoserine O-acetyltransferase [Planctomycetaceae bacterium]